jgi:hypothetical protein
MPMDFGQVQRSLCWLHEEIRLEEKKEMQGWPELRITEQFARFGEFRGTPHLMWTHRCVGVGGDGSRLVEYQICEIGKPGDLLVEGSLTFEPFA